MAITVRNSYFFLDLYTHHLDHRGTSLPMRGRGNGRIPILLLLTHSSEIIGLLSMKCCIEMLRNLLYLYFMLLETWNLKRFVGKFRGLKIVIIFLKFIYTFPNSEPPSLLIYHVLVWNRNACIFLLIDPLVPIILKTILSWTWHTKIDEL